MDQFGAFNFDTVALNAMKAFAFINIYAKDHDLRTTVNVINE